MKLRTLASSGEDLGAAAAWAARCCAATDWAGRSAWLPGGGCSQLKLCKGSSTVLLLSTSHEIMLS